MAVERFPVEAGHILMFARSVGDPNPVYADEEYAKSVGVGGIIAPPTFVQASAQFDPDYFLRPKVGAPWFGSGKEPSGIKRESGGGGRRWWWGRRHRPARRAALHVSPAAARGRRAHGNGAPGRTVGEGRQRARASSCSPRPSPSTATRTASSSSPRAASACGPRRWCRADGAQGERVAGGPDVLRGRRRRSEANPDRAVRGRVRRLQPAAHRRGVRDQGRRLPDGVRARDARRWA